MGLKGYGLWAMGQLDSTCRAPPWYSSNEYPSPPCLCPAPTSSLSRASGTPLFLSTLRMLAAECTLCKSGLSARMYCASPRSWRSGASCNLKRHVLKPGFHLVGARVETTWVPGAFQLWVRGSQRAPPPPLLI
jgi:hypothetical protein